MFFFSYIIFTNYYFVEPVTLPPIVSGCLSNNDCPDYTACQSRKCINPCAAPNVCAPNANCRVTRHQAVCTCPDGYVGSPETSCSLRKLKSQNIPNIYQKQFNIYYHHNWQSIYLKINSADKLWYMYWTLKCVQQGVFDCVQNYSVTWWNLVNVVQQNTFASEKSLSI